MSASFYLQVLGFRFQVSYSKCVQCYSGKKDSLKILGVTIDTNLTFKEHLKTQLNADYVSTLTSIIGELNLVPTTTTTTTAMSFIYVAIKAAYSIGKAF